MLFLQGASPGVRKVSNTAEHSSLAVLLLTPYDVACLCRVPGVAQGVQHSQS